MRCCIDGIYIEKTQPEEQSPFWSDEPDSLSDLESRLNQLEAAQVELRRLLTTR